jgi:GTP cyclohydrolase II
MLHDLGVGPIQLLTNNPDKVTGLQELGVAVVEQLPITGTLTADNVAYLTTKVQRMHHLLALTSNPKSVTMWGDRAVLSFP